MKASTVIFSLILCCSVVTPTVAATEVINIPKSKVKVIPSTNRNTVLSVGAEVLDFEKRTKPSTIDYASIKNPFLFKEIEIVEEVVQEIEEQKPKQIVYSDKAILKAVAQKFSPSVQGTMARGAVNYLQIKGGTIMKPGSTFPVSLPELNVQSKVVTLSDVTEDGYTLKIDNTEHEVSFVEASARGAKRYTP